MLTTIVVAVIAGISGGLAVRFLQRKPPTQTEPQNPVETEAETQATKERHQVAFANKIGERITQNLAKHYSDVRGAGVRVDIAPAYRTSTGSVEDCRIVIGIERRRRFEARIFPFEYTGERIIQVVINFKRLDLWGNPVRTEVSSINSAGDDEAVDLFIQRLKEHANSRILRYFQAERDSRRQMRAS